MNNTWKYIVIALLASVAIFHVGAIVVIGDRDYQLTSDDYYDREIAYQDTLEALRLGKALVWQAVEQNGRLEVGVKDLNGQAVVLAEPSVHLYKPNDAAQDSTQKMDSLEPGRYQLAQTVLKPGPWQLTVEGQYKGQKLAWQTRLLVR